MAVCFGEGALINKQGQFENGNLNIIILLRIRQSGLVDKIERPSTLFCAGGPSTYAPLGFSNLPLAAPRCATRS